MSEEINGRLSEVDIVDTQEMTTEAKVKSERDSKTRRLVVLPICLIALNVFNKVILYKLEMVENVFLRVLLILILLITGFSLVGMFLTPAVERIIATILKGFGKAAGRFGMVIVGLLLAVSMYFSYLTVYAFGLETVLPESLHNPPLVAVQRFEDREKLKKALAHATEAGKEGGEGVDEATQKMVDEFNRLMGLAKAIGAPALGGLGALLVALYIAARRRRKKKKKDKLAKAAAKEADSLDVDSTEADVANDSADEVAPSVEAEGDSPEPPTFG